MLLSHWDDSHLVQCSPEFECNIIGSIVENSVCRYPCHMEITEAHSGLCLWEVIMLLWTWHGFGNEIVLNSNLGSAICLLENRGQVTEPHSLTVFLTVR